VCLINFLFSRTQRNRISKRRTYTHTHKINGLDESTRRIDYDKMGRKMLLCFGSS